jgi:hypothetical protein
VLDQVIVRIDAEDHGCVTGYIDRPGVPPPAGVQVKVRGAGAVEVRPYLPADPVLASGFIGQGRRKNLDDMRDLAVVGRRLEQGAPRFVAHPREPRDEGGFEVTGRECQRGESRVRTETHDVQRLASVAVTVDEELPDRGHGPGQHGVIHHDDRILARIDRIEQEFRQGELLAHGSLDALGP